MNAKGVSMHLNVELASINDLSRIQSAYAEGSGNAARWFGRSLLTRH